MNTITGDPVIGNPSAIKIVGNPTRGRFRILIGGQTTRWLPHDIRQARLVKTIAKLPGFAGKVTGGVFEDLIGPTTTLADPVHGFLIYVDFGPDCSDVDIAANDTGADISAGLALAAVESNPHGTRHLGERFLADDNSAVWEVIGFNPDTVGFLEPVWAKTVIDSTIAP